HSFPEPQWAESLLRAHQQECVAVAPAIENGNPNTTVSWANFLLCFIDWFNPAARGPVESGPGHNTSYKRDALLQFGDLPRLLVSERLLHFEMIAAGGRILIEPEARTHHVNISRVSSDLGHSFLGGRVFGGSRASNWSKAKALVYAAAFPLVPIVRIRR